MPADRITFYSHCVPALEVGAYTVQVRTRLVGDGRTRPTPQPPPLTFHVDAPRFSLAGPEAYACHPMPGQVGSFDGVLPHIVFDRCTLPWERPLDPRCGPVVRPWLALVLLCDEDFATPARPDGRVPPIASGTLRDLVAPGPDIVGPAITLGPHEPPDEPCRFIDLPGSVFQRVMPRLRELPYLAHVREVELGAKETWSLLKEGRFAVVVCNRFPRTQARAEGPGEDWGIVNTLCLVSLEGWAAQLGGRCTAAPDRPHRVSVLASWRFTCQGKRDFAVRMERLDDRRLIGLDPLPGGAAHGAGAPAGLEALNAGLRLGFVPLNHALRHGENTISWYRGPIVPSALPRAMSPPPIACADAALRFDPGSGMLDTSLAAAWQLGRLLALQDQAFSQGMAGFRRDFQRWVRHSNDAALEALALPVSPLRRLLGGRTSGAAEAAGILVRAGLVSGADGPAPAPVETACPEIPAPLQDWLGQALLLYGVPFTYLVADERMLPPESIRFFELDAGWIDALLQGACSVGRTTAADELVDQFLRARFFDTSQALAARLRANAAAAAREARSGREPDAAGPSSLHWPLTGYLLRSAAVEAWIGLEADASGRAGAGTGRQALQILRMDRLAPDVLLCIFNGRITRLELRQPPEAMHFGAKADPGPSVSPGYRKPQLRTPDLGTASPDGLDIPLRRRGAPGVLDVARLARDLALALGKPPRRFGAADLALQMIDSPATIAFDSDDAKDRP